MPVLEVNGSAPLEITNSGFLVNAAEWDKKVAEDLAARSNILLTESHWEIIRYIRGYYFKFHHLPNARMFVKAIQKEFGEEKGNSRYLHGLFPEGPLRFACLIAGLPKPPGCL